MSESLFFVMAVVVFALLLTGLVLTIIEFRHGGPRRQQNIAERREVREQARKAG